MARGGPSFELWGGRSFVWFERTAGFISRSFRESFGRINPNKALLGVRVKRIAAQGRVLGMIDQFFSTDSYAFSGASRPSSSCDPATTDKKSCPMLKFRQEAGHD